MKKIAFITDGWERYVTYAWIEGYRRYMAEHPLTADLYVFHSFGNFSKDQNFNTGEYNIIQLPDLSGLDVSFLAPAHPALSQQDVTFSLGGHNPMDMLAKLNNP